MPDKLVRMQRADRHPGRPVMLAIAGDSAAGKTTLTRGLVRALGPDRCVSICVDDYHRYDRRERRSLPFTPLHPDCNYIEVMEQHLRLLATGEPVLKPVYDHTTGELVRPELVVPRQYVIVEGLLPLHTRLMRACFDITVFLDPPEEFRRRWKIGRDTRQRGYTPQQVLDELDRREEESAAYIRPQRRNADIVVRFAPIPTRNDPPGTPLSAELLLRPTIRHPNVVAVVGEDDQRAMHCKLLRDEKGVPVDALHIHGHAAVEDSRVVKREIWEQLPGSGPLPDGLGELAAGVSSEPLAITQLVLLYHIIDNAAEQHGDVRSLAR